MSKYTTEVRFYCETVTGYDKSQGYSSVDDILTKACPLVFDFDFPIFDEDYRLGLEKKILRHYYTREISEETVSLWKLRLCDKLNLIMPYYNKLYESELLEFNPFYDVDLDTTHTKGIDATENIVHDEDSTSKVVTDSDTTYKQNTDTDTTNSSTSNTTDNATGTKDGTDWDYYSDTPQGTVGNLDDLTYLTNARKNTTDVDTTDNRTIANTTNASGTVDTDVTGSGTTDSTVDGTGTVDYTNDTASKSTEDYVQKIVGKRGGTSYSKLLSEFRDTFLNIDLMIINELGDLFFNLW